MDYAPSIQSEKRAHLVVKDFGVHSPRCSKGVSGPPATAKDPSLSPIFADFPLTRVRWSISAMLFFATSINYLDRQVLGLLASTLQHSIGWTEAQYGYIVGAFQLAYAVGLVIAGRMIDKLGCRIGYAIVMALWSLASMAHALAASALGFGIARFFLGVSEAGGFPAAIKTTAEWFPQSERSLATGILNSGANIGAVFAPLVIPWITLKFGWRSAFLSTGIFGALWIVWWLTRYYSPKDHPYVSPSELGYIQEDSAEPAKLIPWKMLLACKQTWAFAVAKFLTDPIWYFYLYWLPKFFDERYHLGLSRIGLPLIVVYNVSAVGSIGGGVATNGFPQNRNVDGQSPPVCNASLRLSRAAGTPVEPVFLAVGRGRNTKPCNSRASGVVCESVYHRLGYVSTEFHRRSRRDRRHGRLARLRSVFAEHRVGAAVLSQLRPFVLRRSGFVSSWTSISPDSRAGTGKSRCAREPGLGMSERPYDAWPAHEFSR